MHILLIGRVIVFNINLALHSFSTN